MPPTPNARLHLGHIAGPYLTADVINRTHKSLGYKSMLLSGFDSLEDWVVSKTTEDLRAAYDEATSDFTFFQIEFDHFTLPNDHIKDYERVHRLMHHNLSSLREFSLIGERVYRSKKKYGFNSNIAGMCKSCGQEITGYSCPYCFHTNEPSELISPKALFDGAKQTKVYNAFLECQTSLLPDNLSDLQDEFLDSIRRLGKFNIRLTYQSDHGIMVANTRNTVIRNHLYYYFKFLCSVHDIKNAMQLNLFMGMDNFFPSGISFSVISQLLEPDCERDLKFFTNFMLKYEGDKFSKSKSHGPTVADARGHTQCKSEASAYRVFLSAMPIGEAQQNFTTTAFNIFRKKYLENLSALKEKNPDAPIDSAPSESLAKHLQRVVKQDVEKCEITRMYLGYLSKASELEDEQLGDLFVLMRILDPSSHKEMVCTSTNV